MSQASYTLHIAKHLHRLRASYRSAPPTRREHTRLRGANAGPPGPLPGMDAHAPSQDRWWRGRARRGAMPDGGAIFALFQQLKGP